MKHLGYPQLTMADLLPGMVTVIQYHRTVHIYDKGDPRVGERVALLHTKHDAYVAAAARDTNIIRAAGHQFQLAQRHVEVFDTSRERIFSDEIRVEMMDSLMDVHDHTQGKECC